VEPVVRNHGAEFDETVKVHWLYQKRVCADSVGVVDIANVLGRGEHNDAQTAEVGLGADPSEHFEAVYFGEFEIEENEVGQWVEMAIGEFADAAEIFDGFLAVSRNLDGILDAGVVERAQHEENVINAILD
jgi:hypothetical protein